MHIWWFSCGHAFVAHAHACLFHPQVFGGFGRIENIWVARNPPGFAFVTFSDPRDAEDAVRDKDGADFRGSRCVSTAAVFAVCGPHCI